MGLSLNCWSCKCVACLHGLFMWRSGLCMYKCKRWKNTTPATQGLSKKCRNWELWLFIWAEAMQLVSDGLQDTEKTSGECAWLLLQCLAVLRSVTTIWQQVDTIWLFLLAFNKNQIGFVFIFTLMLHMTRGYMSLFWLYCMKSVIWSESSLRLRWTFSVSMFNFTIATQHQSAFTRK